MSPDTCSADQGSASAGASAALDVREGDRDPPDPLHGAGAETVTLNSCPPRNLGIAFADGLRERSGAVYHASRSEGGRGREAGAPAACVDDAGALDPKAGFLESGAELCRRKGRRRPR
jgi:hypothetical protein